MADKGAVGVKAQESKGPMAGIGGRPASAGVPPDLIVVIVANYGQTGGGISIFTK